MQAYAEEYLSDVVENQGKLFDYVAFTYPDCDTVDFITSYMSGKTRKAIDSGQAYVTTMDYKTLWEYFSRNENYTPKKGSALEGFLPEWIGEFYAYYQWYYNIPSSDLVKKIPVDFLKKAYAGLHDLELEQAVKKVGGEHCVPRQFERKPFSEQITCVEQHPYVADCDQSGE